MRHSTRQGKIPPTMVREEDRHALPTWGSAESLHAKGKAPVGSAVRTISGRARGLVRTADPTKKTSRKPGWPGQLACPGRGATRGFRRASARGSTAAELTPLAAAPPGQASCPGHPAKPSRLLDSQRADA